MVPFCSKNPSLELAVGMLEAGEESRELERNRSSRADAVSSSVLEWDPKGSAGLVQLQTCFDGLYKVTLSLGVRGAVASWLLRSSPDRAVRVRALAGDIVLCSWARHFNLTVPPST